MVSLSLLDFLEALRHIVALLLNHLFLGKVIGTNHISHCLLMVDVRTRATNSRPLQVVLSIILHCDKLTQVLVDSVDRLNGVINL